MEKILNGLRVIYEIDSSIFKLMTKIKQTFYQLHDTNLLFSNCDIQVLFVTVNSELSKINPWFLANKLSLNVTKTVFIFP